MIVPHELERIEEEDEDQIARQEQQRDQQEDHKDQEEGRRRGVELGRPRTPEPMGLGMTHLPLEDDEDPHRESSPLRSPSVIDQLFEQLTILSNQLESAVELSGSLQAQHATAQSTISVLESKVITLEGLVKSSPFPIESTCSTLAEPAASPPPSPSLWPNSLMQMLNEWKQTVDGQWLSVGEEWTTASLA